MDQGPICGVTIGLKGTSIREQRQEVEVEVEVEVGIEGKWRVD